MTEQIFDYAPIILVTIYILVAWHITVTPTDLEKKHREILTDVDKKLKDYAPMSTLKVMEENIRRMYEMVTVLYEVHMKGKDNGR